MNLKDWLKRDTRANCMIGAIKMSVSGMINAEYRKWRTRSGHKGFIRITRTTRR